MQLDPALQSAIYPKNILLIGPTGCGKSEIVRSLSLISNSPFIKVEATQYTEIGYHGKDVDQMVGDLVAKTCKKTAREIPQLNNSMAEDVFLVYQDRYLHFSNFARCHAGI